MKRSQFVASLRDMNPTELGAKIDKMRAEVFEERMKVEALGMGYAQKQEGKMRRLKRDVARALTIQAEKRRAG